VIIVSRLTGTELALNPDLVERVEATPETVVTLVDGARYVVSESLTELVRRVREFRASVLAEAAVLERHLDESAHPGHHPGGRGSGRNPDDRTHERMLSPVAPLPVTEP
jgi:flagellar protein FlbD